MLTDLTARRNHSPDLCLSPVATRCLRSYLEWSSGQECVGALIGTLGYVTEAVRLLNSSGAPDTFRIEAFELVRVARYAARRDQQVLALYHSHPGNDLRLSDQDRKALSQSRWPWLIVSLDANQLDYCGYAAGSCEQLCVTDTL